MTIKQETTVKGNLVTMERDGQIIAIRKRYTRIYVQDRNYIIEEMFGYMQMNEALLHFDEFKQKN